MNDESTKEYREELVKSAKCIMEEVNADQDVVDRPLPPHMHEKIMWRIRAYETGYGQERLSAEETEFIRLGKLYKKKRKMRKYFVLAAAVIGVLAFGITSMGENEKIFGIFKRDTLGREQTQVNSGEKIEIDRNLKEEQVYEKIESIYGFYPVRLNYLPDGIGFLEADISEEIPNVYMLYGVDEEVKISYQIRPNYRESSWGKDIEDELLEEYEMQVKDVTLHLQRYRVENGVERWIVKFKDESASYSLAIVDYDKEEVEKIVENLYFYE